MCVYCNQLFINPYSPKGVNDFKTTVDKNGKSHDIIKDWLDFVGNKCYNVLARLNK